MTYITVNKETTSSGSVTVKRTEIDFRWRLSETTPTIGGMSQLLANAFGSAHLHNVLSIFFLSLNVDLELNFSNQLNFSYKVSGKSSFGKKA